jgi:hypothetical protein
VGEAQPRVDLQLVEARAGSLADPPELLVDALREGVRCRRHRARGQRRVHPDDVGVLRGERQHAPAAAGHEDRRAARPVRLGRPVQSGDPVMLAREVERALAEQALEHRDVLDHPADAHPRPVHRDARAGIVLDLIPGADADLQPPFGDQVERRQLARQHRRMPEVGGEDGGGDVQDRRRRGRDRHRGDRPVPLVEVIGREERRVAERLQLTGRVGPRHPGKRLQHLDAEPERTRVGHAAAK